MPEQIEIKVGGETLTIPIPEQWSGTLEIAFNIYRGVPSRKVGTSWQSYTMMGNVDEEPRTG